MLPSNMTYVIQSDDWVMDFCATPIALSPQNHDHTLKFMLSFYFGENKLFSLIH